MLFNSLAFIFIFFPATLTGFALLNKLGSRSTKLWWIVLCSMVFYAVWVPINLVIVLLSIMFNYIIAKRIQKEMESDGERAASILLALGVTANLCLLGYFKYKNFFLENLNEIFQLNFPLAHIALPLGISFITFQLIGFLMDIRSRAIEKISLSEFFVFVFFFPQLIAGPIVHYREMMPQFSGIKLKLDGADIAAGIALFSFGLFKKVVLADGIAPYASVGFTAATQGEEVGFITAWVSALAFTFQIYFDFSGYSDMALGLGRFFGITLPANFNSPLKASSVIEFWNRWHMTLTRFLTDYIYNPTVLKLSRSRMKKGKPVMGRRRPELETFIILVSWPTMFVMIVSGFWHGSGFTYILWGVMHGVFLVINHAWRQWRPKWDSQLYDRVMSPLGFFITFTAIVLSMVMFRAGSVADAIVIYKGLVGINGVTIPIAVAGQLGPFEDILMSMGVTTDLSSGRYLIFSSLWIFALFTVSIFLPNSLDIMRDFKPAQHFHAAKNQPKTLRHQLTVAKQSALTLSNSWALLVAALFVLGVIGLSQPSEFLYWQF
ncbi:MBOAT family protein [bacterium]|nr:MBOAT family protein [bacterium]